MKYTYDFNINENTAPSIIARRIKNNSCVLEFGTADGVLTRYLKIEKKCDVFGVEIDKRFAKHAKEYINKMHIGDIESYKWKEDFDGIRFDHIIFADVLEHLINPWEVIEEAKRFLSDDGVILLSIPNISHSSILIGLLIGDFNYTETGLLDKTHVRFFTKKEIDKLITNAGLHIYYESGVFLPPHRTEQEKSYNMLPYEISRYIRNRPYSEVYQFIYEVGPHEKSNNIEYNNSHLVRISAWENSNSEPKVIFCDSISENDIVNFEVDINQKSKIRNIHIIIDNVRKPYFISQLLINGVNYKKFTTNYPSEEKSHYSIPDYTELYLPLSNSINCNKIKVVLSKKQSTYNKNIFKLLKIKLKRLFKYE